MDLEQFKKNKSDMSKALAKHSKQILVDEFKTFFKANPEVKAISWEQYTPYFNDGDVCEFSRHNFSYQGDLEPHMDDDTDKFDSEEFYSSYSLQDNCSLKAAARALEKTFADTDDVFQAAFGDGVKVVATSKGFTVEEYDHD